jgi:hypothetical protein
MICTECSTRSATKGALCSTCDFLKEADERRRRRDEEQLTFEFVDPRTLSPEDKSRHAGQLRRALVAR